MDVGGVVPARRQILRARHVTADQELQPHSPEAEIGERDDGAPADAQEILQHDLGLACRLKRLRQDHIVEGIIGIIDEVGVGVTLHHRKALGHAAVDALPRQLDAAAVDAAGLQQLKQIPLATADVEHFRAGLDHFGDQQMVGAIVSRLRGHDTVERQHFLRGHVSRPWR